MKATRQNFQNYLFILFTSVSTGAASFVAVKIVQARFDVVAFENFVLMLRYAGFIVPVLIIGMGVAVPRYAGLVPGTYSIRERIVPSAVVAVLVTTILFITSSFFFHDSMDSFLFHGTKHYWFAALFYIATTYYALAYAVLRGRERYKIASITEIATKIILPIAFLLVFNRIGLYFVAISISMMIVSLLIVSDHLHFKKISIDFAIIRYGCGRVLGDILYPLLFSLPIMFSSYSIESAYAVELSVLIMIMNVFLIPVVPISVMLLPRVGQLIAIQSGHSAIKLRSILIFSASAGALAVLVYFGVGVHIVGLFSYAVSEEFWVLGLALFFNVIYVLLRSLIDGLYTKPYLMRFLALAALLELVVIGLVQSNVLDRLALSYAIAASLAAVVFLITTLLFLRRKEWQAGGDEVAEI